MKNRPSPPSAWGPRPGRRRPLSSARAGILQRVQGQPEPVALAALTAFTGLHQNTVREHLNALVALGLVARVRREPSGRGRPAWLYEATDRTRNEYAELAAVLSYAIAESVESPARIAETAGAQWGERMSAERQHRTSSAESARALVIDVLDDLGFEPEEQAGSPDVLLTQCPLLEVAHRHESVVCAVHLGLVRGMLRGQGVNADGVALHPFSDPGGCRLSLLVAEADAPR